MHGLVEQPATAPGTARGSATAGSTGEPPAGVSNPEPVARSDRPRVILDLEGHTVVLTRDDLVLLALVLVAFSGTITAVTEVLRR